MLVALNADQRVTAWEVQKGPQFVCPKCRMQVTLKKGRLVAHHFAHKPPVTCPWAAGETQGHLKAKMLLHATFTSRGLGAAVEAEVLSDEGDRRADVLVWWPQGRAALEVQHQPLSFEAIDRRTRAYIAAGVPVIWLGLISQDYIDSAETTPTGRKISRYAARPWEKWAHAYGMGQLWFVDPVNSVFWRGVLRVRNPEQGDQRFHGKATTESTAIRPPVPRDRDHRFRWKATTSTDARPVRLGMAANLLLDAPSGEERRCRPRESRCARSEKSYACTSPAG